MGADLFEELEGRIDSLLRDLNGQKLENVLLRQEIGRLSEERGSFKSRIDSILKRLEGV